MNMAEFSRLHKVSRKTATVWKKDGIIVLNEDGSVNVEVSEANLKRNRGAKHSEGQAAGQYVTSTDKVTDSGNSSGSTWRGNTGNTDEPESVFVERIGNTSLESLSKADLDRLLVLNKVLVAEQEAKAAQYDNELRERTLLLADDVARHDAEVGNALRNKLLALPSELAVQLAAINEPAEVERMLRSEIKIALTEFLDAYGVSD